MENRVSIVNTSRTQRLIQSRTTTRLTGWPFTSQQVAFVAPGYAGVDLDSEFPAADDGCALTSNSQSKPRKSSLTWKSPHGRVLKRGKCNATMIRWMRDTRVCLWQGW